MSYLYNKKKKKKVYIYLALSLLFILALFTSFYSYLYDLLEKPFLSAYSNTEELKKDSQNLFQTIFYARKVIEENKELKNKIEKLEIDVMRTEYLESLFMESEKVISLDLNIIFTSIVKKNGSGIITVLGGSDSSFSINDIVLGNDNVVIGRVVEVFDNTSQVNLFVKNEEPFTGVLFPYNISINTTGNGNALFAELSREIEVEIGDIVYSQGEPGYVVGVVSYVDFDPRDPVKKVYISPVHGIQSLQNVGVIKS